MAIIAHPYPSNQVYLASVILLYLINILFQLSDLFAESDPQYQIMSSGLQQTILSLKTLQYKLI